MRKYIIISLILTSNYLVAQIPLDTIYANESKNVALFFPESIRQGITGANHFVFTYNREKGQYFGLIQAQPGVESNLLAITNDGQVYSYILKYNKEISKVNYFITKNESIGTETPELKLLPKEKKVIDPIEDRGPYFQKFSDYLLKSKYEKMATKRKKGMKLQLQKMVYNASEVYLVLEIDNKSGIDFEIDYLNIYRTNGNKKRKASYQKLRLYGVYKHKMLSEVKNKQINRFVYVLPKFVLGDNEKLEIELQEMKGSRKVILKTRL
ncbi:DUF4138 domain-containing protein [Seonamhaeicola maritimus]|uniref:DUF4138 domain-containing protein n=1 Tax=Seonamhaeicola maritimus TaxID=2591822 RepID=A0A5C7GMR9_9FLAO|nr:DUF4138 domain-containing protein [Seonamhaeicola maritimus]TXG39595.1 DUF4138 domain-containing protein [Seonamhaeicola maritimus]